MKITAEKREDILREQEEYNRQLEENNRAYEEEKRAFQEAEDAVVGPVKEYLENELKYYRVLSFDVRVERGWKSYTRGMGLEVDIKCNERNLFGEDSALSWNFDVSLVYNDSEGTVEVKKETGSWSGLKATTPAQLKSLRQSVDAIEFLNDVDWKALLNKKLPKYEDYLKTRQMKDRSSEFNKRLADAELEELVGANTLIKVQNFESSGYRGRSIYLKLLRETPSQYVVNILTDWDIERIKNGTLDLDQRYTQRVKKTNVVPVMEQGKLVTVEV